MPVFDDSTAFASLNTLVAAAGDPERNVLVTDDQAKALYRRWNNALAARLDYALEFHQGKTLQEAVVAAWLELAAEQQPLRSIVDQHANREVLRPCIDQELSMLALAAGLAGLEDRPPLSVELGLSLMLGLRGRILLGEGSESSCRVA